MKRQRQERAGERGFTLVEMLIAMVIVAGITGAIATALITSLRAHETSRHRISESNDAQFISSFLVRDAQAAGGTNPATGAIDSSLGVSLVDAAGCTAGSGTLVARFRWIDRSVASSPSRVATYYAAGNLLTRQLCTDGALTTTTTLGRNVVNATASCNPSNACASGGSGLPDTVELTVTETNTPRVAPTPYTYTLRAFVRPEAQTPPAGGTAQVVPLLALGTGACDGQPALSVSGNSSITVNGAALVNAPCPGALYIQGNPDYSATGGTSIAGGDCAGNRCGQADPLTSYAPPIPDPLAGLPPLPNADCSTGSGNPAQVAGRYQPGVYHNALNLGSGPSQFDPGNYVFCAGFNAGAQTQLEADRVLFYIAGGAFNINGGATVNMSPPTSGNYRELLVWQPASNTTAMTINGNAAINNYRGIFYVPGADVTLSGTAGAIVGSIIAQRIIFIGTQTTTVGPQALAIATAGLPTGMVGTLHSASLAATGGVAPYAWSSSALPGGLTLDTSTGVISGTPTSTANNMSIVVSVTDSTLSLVSRTLTMTITASLAITTPALPNGAGGIAYAGATVTAAGGSGNYTWTAAGLPTGMSMGAASGQIAGTPTVSGSFPVTVTATDMTTSATANRVYNLSIAPGVTNVVLSNGNGRAARNDTITITFSEAMDTTTLCSGWDGASRSVTVTITNDGSNDTLSVSGCALGTLALGGNYVSTTGTFSGPGGNASTIAWAAATRSITITLGTASGSVNSGVPLGTPTYTPDSAVSTAGGVPIGPTPFSPAGTSRF